VVLSSHNLPEVLATCDRVVIVHRGQLVADGTPADLEARGQANPRVVVKIRRAEGQPNGVAEGLGALPGVKGVVPRLESARDVVAYEIEAEPGQDVREAVFRACAERGWGLVELHRDVMDLEALFGRLTRES